MTRSLRVAPAIRQALAECALVAVAPMPLPGLPAARLRAVLALDGDLLLAIETGTEGRADRITPAALGRLLSDSRDPMEAAAKALFAELGARQEALAGELRRLSWWLRLPEAAVLLASLAPVLHDLLAGAAASAADYAIALARTALALATIRMLVRVLLRRLGRRLLHRLGG